MMREQATNGAPVAVEEQVHCTPERAEQTIRRVLGNGHEITKTLSAGHVAQDVLLKLGRQLGDGVRVTLIPVAWRVPNSHAFPEFEGFFQIGAIGDGNVSLALHGRYVPPFGGVGAIFDAVVGRFIALATIQRLLVEIIQSIEQDSA
jgi:hypothetical protein